MKADALILVDIQEGFRDPRWGTRNQPDLEKVISSLLNSFRSRRKMVIHVRHNSLEENSPLRAGLPGFEFMSCAIPNRDESVLTKQKHAAFVGTPLEELLRKGGVMRPAFAGLTTDHCVNTSVRLAHDLGFEPILIADATATFPRRLRNGTWLSADTVHEAAIASLNGEFAVVLDSSADALN